MYNFDILYNKLVRKVNEIIDTMEELEELDTIAFKSLNENINNINEMLIQGAEIDWSKLEERLSSLEDDVKFIKGDVNE